MTKPTAGKCAAIVAELQRRIHKKSWCSGDALPTERRLAAEFGASQSTVKKALDTLKREGLIRSHQGKGRFVAESATPARTWTVAVIMSTLDHLHHPLHSRRLAGIQEALLETSYHLTIHAISPNSNRKVEGDSRYRWRGLIDPTAMDGAIVHSRHATVAEIAELADMLPICVVHRQKVVPHCACVRPDFTGAGFDAAAHLMQLGHRDIALVSVNDGDPIGEAQRQGVRLAADKTGHGRTRARFLEAAAFSIAEGRRIGTEIARMTSRPTAVIAGADELAEGIFHALRERDVVVPRDLSLIGWNDTLTEADVPLPMTTVQRHPRLLGKVCVQELIQLIESPHSNPETKWIPMNLLVRESTGCPPP